MPKIVTISSDRNGRKKAKTCESGCQLEFEGQNDGQDRISTLPDEVIILIISLLTVREMVSTSVLSCRWKYLWTYACNFDFNSSKILHALELHGRDRTRIRDVQNYINMVKRVLSSIQVPSVDLLRIRFDVGISHHNYEDDMKKWIDFAIEKGVKRLEMDMSSIQIFHCWEPYPFHRSDFKSLEVLRLKSFNVTGETLENIFLNCQLLECVSVTNSIRLGDLKVTSKSLRCLEIYWCRFVKKIEVNAENLKILKYGDYWNIELALNYAPRLVELYFGKGSYKFFLDNIPHFSSHLSRLETLGLDISTNFEESKINQLPVLDNIKQLEVRISASYKESLFGLISLLKKFPFLQKFSLWLSTWPGEEREIMEAEKFDLDHLKVVEFHGFIGHATDKEFATYLLENAPALEKIIIDRATTNIFRLDSAVNFRENRKKISARKQARLLSNKLRPGVTMVIQ